MREPSGSAAICSNSFSFSSGAEEVNSARRASASGLASWFPRFAAKSRGSTLRRLANALRNRPALAVFWYGDARMISMVFLLAASSSVAVRSKWRCCSTSASLSMV